MIEENNESKPQQCDCLSIDNEEGNEIILFNDNIHSFNYVIDCLMNVCKLSIEQASTCANIAHYKGLCAVKHGAYDELNVMCKRLISLGLKVEMMLINN